MKKVFVVSLPGAENKLMVAKDQEEAFEKRSELDHAYEYLPVEVKELEIEGYDIFAKEKAPKKAEPEEQPIEPEQPPEAPKQTLSKKNTKAARQQPKE